MKTINTRLKKVIGQISGIIKMIEEEQDCEKIIIQFQAAKAALDSAFCENLNLNLKKCCTDNKNLKNKNISKILKLISKK